ncbi:MAG TPA: phosphoribosyltransferase family protein [Nitrososphaera sp.]|nr:phosphoribosyltransferase family protein [Nitrososphaera sp.]
MSDTLTAKAEPALKVIYDAAAVSGAISKLAAQVIDRYKGRDALFVSLLNGGPVFSTMLMMEADRQDPDFCPEVCYLNIETYGDGQTAREPKLTQPLSSGTRVKGRVAVVLDEVLDSGVTTAKAEEYLRSLGAEDVELVVLVRKERQRKAWQEATLYALAAPDVWLNGLGMDGSPGRPPEVFRFADYISVVEPGE